MPHFKNLNNELFWLDEGNDPSVWLPNCTLITDAEADSIRSKKVQDVISAMTYAEKRAVEYPSIGDQLDALFHAGVFPDEMAAQIQAVKDKYPKG